MKPNKFMTIISVLTLFIVLVGATFAYFSVSVSSNEDAIAGEAAVISISLDVQPLYTGRPLIPTNDSDIDTAYANSCVDIHNNGACGAYTITVTNAGQATNYTGTIKFNLTDITNFKYRLLDENDNVYQDTTTVITGTDQSLGNSFVLATNEAKTFTLIVWLPNMSYEQDASDANGHFSADVTYTTSAGSRVTGMFTA
jgi:hypothetical protein